MRGKEKNSFFLSQHFGLAEFIGGKEIFMSTPGRGEEKWEERKRKKFPTPTLSGDFFLWIIWQIPSSHNFHTGRSASQPLSQPTFGGNKKVA